MEAAMSTQQSQNVPSTDRPASTTTTVNGPLRAVPSTPPSSAGTPLATPPSSGPPTPAATPATAKKQARGSSFTTPEDEALAKAWARVSEDAVTGSDQKGEVFFKAVHDLFDTLKPGYCQARPVKSTTRRAKKILTECLAFSGCVAKVRNARPSGASNNDIFHLATAMLNKVQISSVTDDCGPPFKFHAAWRVLKDHPKFELYCNPPKPQTANAETPPPDDESDNDENKSNSEEYKRPIGRKRAKAADAKEEVDRKKLKMAEASLSTQRERNELMKEHQEIMLFSSNVDMSDPLVAEYINLKRRRILLREREKTAPKTTVLQPTAEPPVSPSRLR